MDSNCVTRKRSMKIYHLMKNTLLEYYCSLFIQFVFNVVLSVIYEKICIGPAFRNEKELSLTVGKIRVCAE
jgi:hypothetical protein